MAFGPAVLPGVQVGRRVAMILVAKDSTGKARTSGDDLTLARTLTPTLTLTRTRYRLREQEPAAPGQAR